MTIVYNKSTGNVILMMSEKIEAVSSVVADIPAGYTVASVNTETGEPVFEAVPKTEEQKEIDSLKTAAYALASVSTTLTDEQALSMSEFFAEWEPDTKYIYGQVIRRNSQLYRIEQSEVTSIESQPPEAEGMLAVYRPIVLNHTGTLEDPIPWVYAWIAIQASITAITTRFTNALVICFLAFGNPVRQVFTSGRKSLDRLSIHHSSLVA